MKFPDSTHPILDLRYVPVTIGAITDYIKHRAERSIHFGCLIPHDFIQSHIDKFKDDWKKASVLANKYLIKQIRPEHYGLLVFHVLELFLEDQVQKVCLLDPENKEVLSAFEKLKHDLAKMRYKSNGEGFEKIKTFLQYIQNELRRHGESEVEEEETQQVWKAWEQICSNGDVLDLDMVTLCRPEETIEMKVGVKTCCASFALIVSHLNQDLPWLIEKIETEIKPYLHGEQHPVFNNSEKIMQLMEGWRKKLLPLSAKLILKSAEDICNAAELFTMFNNLIALSIAPVPHNRFFPALGDNTNNRKVFTYISDNLSTYPDEKIIDIDEEIIKSGGFNVLQTQGKMSCGYLRAGLRFMKVHNRCHRLVNTYLFSRLERLRSIFDVMEQWMQKIRRDKTLNFALQKLKMGDESPQDDNVDIDQLVKEIHKTKKPKKKSQKLDKPREKKEDKKKVVVPKPKTIPITEKEIVPRAIPGKEIELHPQSIVLMKIVQTFKEQNYRFARIAARHAHMYIEDILFLREKLNHSCPPELRLAVVSAIWQGAYHTLEQQMRYLAIIQKKPFDPNESGTWHGLRKFTARIQLPLSTPTTILDRLNLANFLDDQTFDQYAIRMRMLSATKAPFPSVLRHLVDLAQKPATTDFEVIRNAAKDQVAAALQFAENVPILSPENEPVPIDSEKRVRQSYKQTWQADLSGLLNIQNQLTLKLNHYSLNSLDRIAILFRQTLKDLSTLKGNMILLSGNLSSIEFPQIVRAIIHWQHAMIQNMLRIFIYLQEGVQVRDHNLADMYKRIIWKIPFMDSEHKFLHDYFHDAHRLSSYPFEVNTVQSYLHKAILIAEMLRENPEYNEGFTLTTEKYSSTPLNFIPLPTSDIRVQTIISILKESHQKLIHLFQSRFLPELS